jgi:hypothetical protein
MDVEVYNDEDAELGPKPNALAKKKASADDDAEDGRVPSTKPHVPNPISSAAIRVPIIVPSPSGHGRKRPTPSTRWNKLVHQADQVMTRVELLPYRGPRSPLDLVNIEIIFRHIFEVFRDIFHAVASGAAANDSYRPQKKSCRPPLRKVLAPR